ncbi:unnamed protein product [Chrysoparadoxa australica]
MFNNSFPGAPVFGTAPGSGQLPGDLDLDGIFSEVFFSPTGEMLELPNAPMQQGGLVLSGKGEPASGAAGSGAGRGLQFAMPSHGTLPPTGIGIGRGRGIAAEMPPDNKRARTAAAAMSTNSGDMTEEQKVERRERNREHAKRSRVRKKFLLESLQKSVNSLQEENAALKKSITDHLGDRGKDLLLKCQVNPDEVSGSLVTQTPGKAKTILEEPDYSLVKALQTAQQNFVITDASLPDNPIVFASQGFLSLTGYNLTQVLGRNCRFLQGPETDPASVEKIRHAITEGLDCSVCLLNYCADGTTFWNQFFVAALRDGNGKIVNYVGIQCKVGGEYASIAVDEQRRSKKERM